MGARGRRLAALKTAAHVGAGAPAGGGSLKGLSFPAVQAGQGSDVAPAPYGAECAPEWCRAVARPNRLQRGSGASCSVVARPSRAQAGVDGAATNHYPGAPPTIGDRKWRGAKREKMDRGIVAWGCACAAHAPAAAARIHLAGIPIPCLPIPCRPAAFCSGDREPGSQSCRWAIGTGIPAAAVRGETAACGPAACK